MRLVFLSPTWVTAVLGSLELLLSLVLWGAGNPSAVLVLLLMAGGAAMLVGARRSDRPVLDVATFGLGALPLALLAWGSATAGNWPGALAYGLLAGATAALAALRRDSPPALPGLRRRAAAAALGLGVAATGALLLPVPPGVAPADAATARHLLGAFGLAAAFGSLALGQAPGERDGGWPAGEPQALAMLPLLVLYGLSDAGSPWSGLGLAAWALALVSAPAAGALPVPATADPDDPEGLRATERVLESWSWVVALGVSAGATLSGSAAVSLPAAVPVYLLGVTLYHTTVNWRRPQAGSLHRRLLSQLSFSALALGFLGVSGGYVGHVMRALLAVIPVTAHGCLGSRRGRQMTGLALAVFLASSAGHWALNQQSAAGMHEEILLGLLMVAGGALGSVGRLNRLNRDVAQLQARLTHLESHDTLTGLLNRRQFQAEWEAQLAAAGADGTHWALMLLDVDGLRHINDSVGHSAGDEVLRSVALMLVDGAREPFLAARTGGDEFSLVTRVTDATEPQVIARRILDAVPRHRVAYRGLPLGITASMGAAIFPEHGRTALELQAHAGTALRAAKAQGGGTCVVHSAAQSPRTAIGARLTWDRRVRDAVEEERLVLHAQAILDLRTGSMAGYELLLRMTDPGGQLVLPGAFLDVAERLGLMPAIDRWVVRQAIRLLGKPNGLAGRPFLAVNLSPRALASGELLTVIDRELAATGVDPARLLLEITEAASMADLRQTRAFIASLQARGCRFALDDFSAGFSSMHHLKDLSVDLLKIDGRLVANLTQDPTRQHMVRALVEMAHGLGKEVVAEFVDGAGTLELLRQYGAEHAQGFYIDRPFPVTELAIRNPHGTPPEQETARDA